jgi:RNA polymerase-binding protein DksA
MVGKVPGNAGTKSRKKAHPVRVIAKNKVTAPLPRPRFPTEKANKLRRALLSMREQLTGQISSLTNDSLLRHDASNTEEDGTDAYERQFALNIASSDQDAVYQIDQAMQRLDDGTYGVCEGCQGEIEEARLQALPFVRLCIQCQSEHEKVTGARRAIPVPM